MVPIKEAISGGFWMNCEYKLYNEVIKFRLKINSFKKLDLKEIDNPENIGMLDSDANLMIMEAEVVNLVKESKHSNKLIGSLILIDQDDFKFPIFRDNHLCYLSDFANKVMLNRFYIQELIPKVKSKGSIVFQLPDDDYAEYFISLQNNGIVQEV